MAHRTLIAAVPHLLETFRKQIVSSGGGCAWRSAGRATFRGSSPLGIVGREPAPRVDPVAHDLTNALRSARPHPSGT